VTPLPRTSAKRMAKLLEGLGFRCTRSRGSHFFYRHPDGRTTTIPFHGAEALSAKLIGIILDQVGLTDEDYRRLVAEN
jgi:predicted RNA binding protein YcfA (HicA-like mRNA interferase family)